ncbi:hypothetical protein VTN02DRAFT_407 [Thermoascus thermophilus]
MHQRLWDVTDSLANPSHLRQSILHKQLLASIYPYCYSLSNPLKHLRKSISTRSQRDPQLIQPLTVMVCLIYPLTEKCKIKHHYKFIIKMI